jgi:SNF2 family DNA or RNA helicase
VERFQNDQKCRFFVGNPATGGYGITLTAANTVVYYSNSYSLEQRLQSEDRAHRIGQKNPVLYVDLVTPGTVDIKIVLALAKKIDVQAQITGDELQEWLDVTSLSGVKGRQKTEAGLANGSLAADDLQMSLFEADQLR